MIKAVLIAAACAAALGIVSYGLKKDLTPPASVPTIDERWVPPQETRVPAKEFEAANPTPAPRVPHRNPVVAKKPVVHKRPKPVAPPPPPPVQVDTQEDLGGPVVSPLPCLPPFNFVPFCHPGPNQ